MFRKNNTLGKKSILADTLDLRHDQLLNFSEESLFEGTDRTFSKVYVELPYPIHKSLRTSEDLVLQLLKEKRHYQSILNSTKKRYTQFDKKRVTKHEYDGHKYIYLPKYLVDMYNEKDPDHRFNSDYNYYYTGGNLEHFEFNNHDYLVRPDLENNLCVNNIVSDKDNVNEVIKMNYNTESTIFNIDSAKTYDGLFLILREKYRVTALKCDDITKVSMKYSNLHKQPILDAKLSEDLKLGEVFSFGRFSIKDIETNATILSFNNNLEGNIDKFQQFRFSDENTVVLMDRNRVKVLDIRTKVEDMCFESQLLACNSLYNFILLDNTVLLASRHYILKTDIRKFENVFHYSHSLREAPCYLDYTIKNSDTYLGVSGQNYDSRILFTGKAPYSIPFKVPSLKKTLTECKLKNPSLILEDHLETKLQFSLTGLKMVEIDNNISMYTSNCFGEIFKQNICDKEPDNNRATEIMYKWTKSIEQPEPNLHLTNFEEVSDIRFSLNATVYNSELARYEKPGKEDIFLAKFGPIYSKNNVKSQLAKDFLSIWEDSDEEEEIGSLPQEETLDKVSSWIQTHDFDKNNKD